MFTFVLSLNPGATVWSSKVSFLFPPKGEMESRFGKGLRGRIFIFFLLCFTFQGFSQLTQSLEEVNVIAPTNSSTGNPTVQKLDKQQIQILQPEDAGQLLQKFAGVSLKSYGGLGGMKTISVRGIGGSHTGIVLDGFLIQNNQTGQIDLSSIQTENIESISLSMGGTDGFLLPVSAYLGGSTLSIQTFENRFAAEKVQVRAALKGGSFGQVDSYLSLKYNRKKCFFSIFGKYRQADGVYPFSFENGTQLYSGNRFNNDLKEGFGGLSLGFRLGKRSIVKLNYQFNQADKGLPGAVILYNALADQRLTNESHQLNADYRFIGNGFGIRTYVSARYEELKYVDSAFLNISGFIDNRYFNTSVQHGISFQTEAKRDTGIVEIEASKPKSGKLTFFGGIEQNYSELHSSVNGFAQPQRYHLKSVLGTEKKWRGILAMIQLGGQAVFDKRMDSGVAKSKYIFTPYALVQARKPFYFLGTPVFWVKRTFRMPTFNELYYNQLGNTALKPEIANQVNLGTSYSLNIKNNLFKLNADVYYNLVENKIVSIPTKNLFIWSMQNVGHAQIIGTDVQFSHSRAYNQTWLLSTRVTYTFQQVQDLSDKSSPTYGDQLPYLPKHTGNADFTVTYKKTGLNISALITSERYALNENISANRIGGFYVFDVSAFHIFNFKNAQQLRLSVNVKNVLNQSYAFVRYYVMPGTNLLISLNYAFH